MPAADLTLNEIPKWVDEKSVENVIAVVCDLNGVYRGKRAERSELKKLLRGEMKLPLSTMFLDIWGRDTMGSGQVLETGDVDGVLVPIESGIFEATWRDQPTAFAPLTMLRADGERHDADPRQALAAVLDRYSALSLTPVIALELEFYLMHARPEKGAHHPNNIPSVPVGAGAAGDLENKALYSIDALDSIDDFLRDVRTACQAAEIPLGAIVSEGGGGQYEVNLGHRSDALRAADDAQLLKTIIKGVAQKNGMAATFMAKPRGTDAGSGMHMHASVLDADQNNIFDDGTDAGSAFLRNAVGGLQEAMAASMLIFAPHANSYRRLREATHAPTRCAWGYDNRTAAIRIPSGPNSARRVEHRVAGADTNPYLVAAAVLGGIINGIERKSEPDIPLQENAYASDRAPLPATWHEAVANFANAPVIRDIFSGYLADVFAALKLQEIETLAEIVPTEELSSYFSSV